MLQLESLNRAQHSAVVHGEGPLLVLAGPGSGKTYTIIQRIFYLLEVRKVAPEEILVLTFTKDAALSMQRRFQEQSNRSYPVNFGTFHSVFYQILKEVNPSGTKQILKEQHKKNLFFPILQKYNKIQAITWKDYLAAMSFYKNTGNMEQTLNRVPQEGRAYFKDIFSEYENARRTLGVLDFDDMVYECARTFSENVQVRAYWSKRFSHILMDEAQDINPMQYRVIRYLSGQPYNLFAVGDDDQSIYGFRGSNPACMKQFLEDYEAEKIVLNINYRSTSDIVKASLKVISENQERFVKELIPHMSQNNKNTVIIKSHVTKSEQDEYLLKQLQMDVVKCSEVEAEETDTENCAVLFRTNLQMQRFATILNQKGICYEMKERAVSIYEHFIVKDIMAYLRIAAGEMERELWLRILQKPQRFISREALGSITEGKCLKAMKHYYEEMNNLEIGFRGKTAISLLEKQLEDLKKLSPYLGVQYIYKVIGYEKFLFQERRRIALEESTWQEWMDIVEWIKQDAKDYQTLQEWIIAQENYEPAKQAKQINSPIHLMTVHASKGLEFDRVYIPDCNEKMYPHGILPDQDTCEEERRLFYVAMTRAKKHLELLFLVGTKERPRVMSRFLNPLLHDSSTSSSNSQLSRYSSKASATASYSSSFSMNCSRGSSLGSSGFSLYS